tara:strand:- start:89 stop:283 length:195 start_codon:yes stop_codon:yes gene_type:complete
LSDLFEINSDIPEVKSPLESIDRKIENLRNHSFKMPFESEPSEFLKILSGWQSKKNKSKDDHEV